MALVRSSTRRVGRGVSVSCVCGGLQQFLAPDALDLLVVGPPTFGTEQFAGLALAITLILYGEVDECQPQRVMAIGLLSVLWGGRATPITWPVQRSQDSSVRRRWIAA